MLNTGSATSNDTIVNNFITDVYCFQDASNIYWPIGIALEGASGGINIYFNSVNLFGSHPGYASNPTGGAAPAMFNNSTGSNIDIRDNAFSSSYENTTSTGDKAYAIYSVAPAAWYSSIDYNDYFVSGPGIPVLGFLGSDQATIGAWRTATTQDLNSKSVDPVFVSSTDLHLQLSSTLLGMGVTIAGVTTDIDGDLRQSPPDIGADEIITYTLDYASGGNGSVTGNTSQTVNYGENGTPVTAVPNVGYHFVNWSDASTDNPRTDMNVMANISVTANFAINTYTLDYASGGNGSVTGNTSQTVNYGGNGTPVTAVPNTGYHFVNWSDASTDNPRTDMNVMANVNVTANFAINTYTLDYASGGNGSLTGNTSQTVNYGENGTPVTAVPNTGYHFVNWSDASTANPRTDMNVMANVNVTANFAINTYTLTYNAGANGSISGTTPQTVNYGENGTAVTAVPDSGYNFVNWSDSSTDNPRTDMNVMADVTVTANFASGGSSNADLSDLTLSAGTLVPAFDPATTSYTASVSNATASITETPTSADAGATIEVRVNGGSYVVVTSGTPSGALALNVGDNPVDTRVTAADTTTMKTYTVVVHRAGPVTTNSGSGLAPEYATLAAAITALNAATITSPVIITLNGGEIAPAGGYVITQSGGTAVNTITIQGSSSTISANASLAAGALNDAIFKLDGASWVTIQNFTMQENPANTNTTPATNNMTEWGVALLYSSPTQGSQNNTIQNNIISLDKNYSNTFGVYSNVRHIDGPTSANVTTLADITNNTTAPNSGNKVYGNGISNVNHGIVFIGSATAANMDVGNDIGGSTVGTGNLVTNYGGLAAATAYVGFPTTIVDGAYINDQNNFNLSNNSFISASLNTAVALRGILTDYVAAPVGTITNNILNNTVTFTQAGAGGMQAITTASTIGAVANVTINMNGNKFVNSAVTGAASAVTMFGVANLGAYGTLNMNNNEVSGNTSTATTGGFVGATNQGAVVNTINILNNNIGTEASGAVTFSAATTGAMTGISNTTGTATTTLNITGNFFRRFSFVSSGQLATIINSAAPIGVAINLNNNHLGTATSNCATYSAASAGNFFGIVNAAGAATASLSISGNDIRGIVQSVAGSGGLNYINNQVFTGATAINNNTFTNIVANSTASAVLISNSVTHAANTVHTVNNNSIVGTFNRTAISGALQLFLSNSSSPATVTETSNGNNFSNITLAGTSTLSPWQNSDGGSPVTNVTNNTFSNIAGGSGTMVVLNASFSGNGTCTGNVISNVTGGGAITGITSTSGNQNLSGNTVNGLASTGAAAVTGISVTGGTTQNLSKNKIYDLSGSNAGSTVNGMLVSSGTTVNVFNNLIGDLRATAASAANPVNGLNVTGGTTVNAYYNTVYLNASSTGTNFGSSAVSVSTAPTVTLRNNAFVNGSTPNGTGLSVAYRRSSTTLTSYGATSNNNDFYAGTPGVANLIFTDGTNSDQTIAAFKTRVSSRDSLSFTENPPFLSTIGSSANFLHINPSIPTQLESGAVNIAGITDDFDMDIRQGNPGYVGTGTAPDVGGDEFNGTPLDLSPPAISYPPFANTLSTSNRTLTSTITDATGVDSGANLPRIYFKKSTDASYVSTQCVMTGGTTQNGTYDCTIDNTLVGGGSVMPGDSIQYFVVAQDTVGNLGSTPAGATGANVNSITFSGTPNSYMILDSIMGKKTVGVGGVYTTLTAAIADLNSKVLSGPVKFTLLDATYPSETFPIVINANPGSSATNTITIQPGTGVSPTISGSSASAIIVINGADWVTIDGEMTPPPPGPSAPAPLVPTRDTTIINTGATGAVVWLESNGVDGATNNTIQNLNLVGNSNTTTLVGVGSGSSTISVTSAGVGNNNNTFFNCNISKTTYGIYSGGASAANKNTGNVISTNLVNAAAPNNVQIGGILVKFENGIQITDNNIANISQSSGAFGIGLGLGDSITNLLTIVSGSDVTNALVSGNKIDSVTSTSTTGFSAAGIIIGPVTSGVTQVDDNMISRVVSQATPSDGTLGIYAMGGTGSTTKIYFNSVSMTGSRANATNGSYALAIGGSNPVVDVEDNIFSNTQTGTSTGKMYAIGTASTTYTNMISNYNDLFVSGTNTFVGQTGSLSTSGTDRPTLLDWQTQTGKDANSISADPLFLSASDLHITCTSPAADAGTPLPGVGPDIDGQPRSLTAPDMGADEIVAPATVSVVSRKTQGGAGTFDINLPGVECRSGGMTGDYEIVATFGSPVTFSGATVTAGTGSVMTTSGNGTNTLTIDLTGVTDVQTITIRLNCVDDGAGNSGNTSVSMGVLLGDTNGDGSVGVSDVAQTKSQSGVTVTGANFRNDVNASGAINAADVGLVKSKSGNMLPP